MSVGNLIFIPMMIAAAVTPASVTPTYGLPSCVPSISGLTERYELNTLYVDLCEDGSIVQSNLEIVDLTESTVLVEVNGDVVVVRLPID